MAVRPIVLHPDPILRRRADPVTTFDTALAGLIEDLRDTLAATGGIGLSAPQLGTSLRVAVIEPSGRTAPPEVYLDPVILRRSAPGLVEESCLSVPEIVGNVWRWTRIRVRARNPHGESFERELENMHAVALQHELDHLDGKLFIDRLWPLRRLIVRARLHARARRAGTGVAVGV